MNAFELNIDFLTENTNLKQYRKGTKWTINGIDFKVEIYEKYTPSSDGLCDLRAIITFAATGKSYGVDATGAETRFRQSTLHKKLGIDYDALYTEYQDLIEAGSPVVVDVTDRDVTWSKYDL
jgi:hypothetical protein